MGQRCSTNLVEHESEGLVYGIWNAATWRTATGATARWTATGRTTRDGRTSAPTNATSGWTTARRTAARGSGC